MFYQSKTGLIVGSGKITRRILPKHFKRVEASLMELRRIKDRANTKRPPLKMTKDERVVLNHWNSKGKPFTKHKTDKSSPTKRLQRIIKSIRRRVKKHKTRDICASMDNIHDLFRNPEFKFVRYKMGINPITLPDFFSYDKSALQRMNPYLEKFIMETSGKKSFSWFKEGLRGSEFLEKEYNIFIEDKHPEISKEIEDVWTAYKGDDYELRPNEVNTIRRITGRVMTFGNANPEICPPAEVVNRLKYMFETLHYKPKRLTYLQNDIFWHDEFPKELIRWSGHHIRDIVIP